MRNYVKNFFEEFDYPTEAREVLLDAFDKIYENKKAAAIFDSVTDRYCKTHELVMSEIKSDLDLAAELTGIHEYTVKLLIHICLSKELRALYKERGFDDSLWFGAMSDLKWKLIESHIVKGVWGTFVSDWGFLAGTTSPASPSADFSLRRSSLTTNTSSALSSSPRIQRS